MEHAVLIMLVSAALHAVWNTAMRKHGDAPAATVLLMAGCCAVTLAVALQGSADPARLRVAFEFGMVAGLLEGFYFIALGRSIHIGPLAAVYTVSRGLPLLALWPASHVLFGERITWQAVAAVALLMMGLVALLPTQQSGGATTTRAGYVWAAMTAGVNLTRIFVFKEAVNRGAPPVALFGAAMLVAVPVVLLALIQWRKGGGIELAHRLARAWRSGTREIAIGAVACAGSFLIALFTMRTEGAAWVLTLRNVSIAFTQILGWAVLHEKPSQRAFIGVLLVFAGAMVLGVAE